MSAAAPSAPAPAQAAEDTALFIALYLPTPAALALAQNLLLSRGRQLDLAQEARRAAAAGSEAPAP